MAAALSLNRYILHKIPSIRPGPIAYRHVSRLPPLRRRRRAEVLRAAAGSRSDDSSSSAPFEMSVENALKLLGVSEGASFDEILRAKNAIVASCKDDLEAIAQVEAAYDMLLMQSLTQRRAGKVVNSSIRYADVKSVRSSGTSSLPQWLQTTVKNVPVSIGTPSTRDLGIQAGVYGALMVFTFASGASTSSAGAYVGADVPGIILATSFGASLYFLTKKSSSLGKATLISVGGLVVGAVIGSAVEQWLQVDIVPFFGIHSPAVIIHGGSGKKSLEKMTKMVSLSLFSPFGEIHDGSGKKLLEKTTEMVVMIF